MLSNISKSNFLLNIPNLPLLVAFFLLLDTGNFWFPNLSHSFSHCSIRVNRGGLGIKLPFLTVFKGRPYPSFAYIRKQRRVES